MVFVVRVSPVEKVSGTSKDEARDVFKRVMSPEYVSFLLVPVASIVVSEMSTTMNRSPFAIVVSSVSAVSFDMLVFWYVSYR